MGTTFKTPKEKFDYQCCLCYSDNELVVHHKSYEEQNINTLFLVCKSCHKEVHSSLLNNQDFLRYKNEGLNDKQISEFLNVSKQSVFRRRHKLQEINI